MPSAARENHLSKPTLIRKWSGWSGRHTAVRTTMATAAETQAVTPEQHGGAMTKPLLTPISGAQAALGGVGRTKIYELVHRREIIKVRLEAIRWLKRRQ